MKRKIILIILILFCLFSCRQEEPKPKHLDVAKLKEMKSKWQSLNIKNYSFTYVFDVEQPRLFLGHVKVENGIGKVIFEKAYKHSGSDSEWEKTFYITSMDGVFDNILDRYLKDKKEWEEGKLSYFDYTDYPSKGVRYNSSYFFPESLDISYEKPPIGGGGTIIGGGHITLKINDFKMIEKP